VRPDVEAAYFALLRAREDETDLRRYREHLLDESRRLRRFRAETAAAADDAPGRLRRRIRHTDEPLHVAVTNRLEAVDDELAHLDERIEAAADYVRECEQHHDRLRRG
jgi:chromosome segregation ATPase